MEAYKQHPRCLIRRERILVEGKTRKEVEHETISISYAANISQLALSAPKEAHRGVK